MNQRLFHVQIRDTDTSKEACNIRRAGGNLVHEEIHVC